MKCYTILNYYNKDKEGSELGVVGQRIREDKEDDDDLSFCCARQISLLRKLTSWDACSARGYLLSSSALGHLYATQKYGQHYRNKSKYSRISFRQHEDQPNIETFRSDTRDHYIATLSQKKTPRITIVMYRIPHQINVEGHKHTYQKTLIFNHRNR